MSLMAVSGLSFWRDVCDANLRGGAAGAPQNSPAGGTAARPSPGSREQQEGYWDARRRVDWGLWLLNHGRWVGMKDPTPDPDPAEIWGQLDDEADVDQPFPWESWGYTWRSQVDAAGEFCRWSALEAHEEAMWDGGVPQ